VSSTGRSKTWWNAPRNADLGAAISFGAGDASELDERRGSASGSRLVGDFASKESALSSSFCSRTVMTAEQFLHRILRILPRTRSSPIE